MPIRRPVNVPGPTPIAIEFDVGPVAAGLRQQLVERGQQLGGVAGRLEQAGRGRRRVVGEGPGRHRSRRRRSRGPSRCRCRSSSSRRAGAASASISRCSPSAVDRCGGRSPSWRIARRSTTDSASSAAGAFRPLDEGNAIGAACSRPAAPGPRRRERLEPVEIDVRDRQPAGVGAPITKVGLVTCSRTPRPRQAPLTNVVLPAPSSPATSTTSPGASPLASASPKRSVCCSSDVSSSSSGIHARIVAARAKPACASEQTELVLRFRRRAPAAASGARRSAAGVELPRARVSARSSTTGCGRRSARAAPAAGGSRPQLLEHRRRVERGGRVEDRQQQNAVTTELVRLRHAAHLRDPVLVARQQLGGEVPQRADHARLDQGNLLEEMVLAGIDLGRLRVAVSGRAAFEHVRNEHLLALEADLRRATCRAACRPCPRTACPACPRGSRAPHRRTSGSRRDRRCRTRRWSAPRRGRTFRSPEARGRTRRAAACGCRCRRRATRR